MTSIEAPVPHDDPEHHDDDNDDGIIDRTMLIPYSTDIATRLDSITNHLIRLASLLTSMIEKGEQVIELWKGIDVNLENILLRPKSPRIIHLSDISQYHLKRLARIILEVAGDLQRQLPRKKE